MSNETKQTHVKEEKKVPYIVVYAKLMVQTESLPKAKKIKSPGLPKGILGEANSPGPSPQQIETRYIDGVDIEMNGKPRRYNVPVFEKVHDITGQWRGDWRATDQTDQEFVLTLGKKTPTSEVPNKILAMIREQGRDGHIIVEEGEM